MELSNTNGDHDLTLKNTELIKDNYIKLFNDEVSNILFAPAYYHDLKDSKIHFKSKVKKFEAQLNTNFNTNKNLMGGNTSIEDIGSSWNGVEKQVFFYCLSRYSIHNLDQWANDIPTKSKLEILAYYNVLKCNYNELKTNGYRGRRLLIKRNDLPIAYEMDDYYIKTEEEIANNINAQDKDDNGSSASSASNLIDFGLWNKKWYSIYSKHRLFEYYPVQKFPYPIDGKAIKYLEKCVKLYIKELLWNIIPNIYIENRIIVVNENDELEEKRNNKEKYVVFKYDKKMKKSRLKKRKLVSVNDGDDTDYDYEVGEQQSSSMDTVSNISKKAKTSDVKNQLEITQTDIYRGITLFKQENRLCKFPLTVTEQIPNTIEKFQLKLSKAGSSSKEQPITMKDIFKIKILKNGPQYPSIMMENINNMMVMDSPAISAPDFIDPLSVSMYCIEDEFIMGKKLKEDDINKVLTSENDIDKADIIKSKMYQHYILNFLKIKHKSDEELVNHTNCKIKIDWSNVLLNDEEGRMNQAIALQNSNPVTDEDIITNSDYDSSELISRENNASHSVSSNKERSSSDNSSISDDIIAVSHGISKSNNDITVINENDEVPQLFIQDYSIHNSSSSSIE
ncbi:Rrn5p SCDLUD_001790 [Saccharomycodes ludwigii]|uniref:Rrn5p n=1 Tax=Saccharomycodes ludwigii TaxID=36035 RepID=UPI001E8C9CCA|nr:hypothetical protein SCDLUD_001790 [Saccharomycodes ludwigii]KAH3902002.1 hypothetical protein SCDLUD_001790 [Saccharomycodes ludwigii]